MKKIQSATDYALNMLNVMVDHDKAGAMEDWVDGTVKAWLGKMIKASKDVENLQTLGDGLSPHAKGLIVRAIMSIPKHEQRTILFSTCLHMYILDLHHIPLDEAAHVQLKPVD